MCVFGHPGHTYMSTWFCYAKLGATAIKAVRTGLWLRPVGVYRTRPVTAPEVLDLSGVDRTLGGSVRSLPLERPVSR